MKKVGQKIDLFFETTLWKVIMWTIEIIAVIALFVMFLDVSSTIMENFTPEQMQLFQRAMDNKVIVPFSAIMCAGFVLIGYVFLNLHRWSHKMDIKELKKRIQELEACQE
ncbi:hypothetical protein MKY98_26950 [Paenibacillus sp. FSL M8-0228]|uniref:hypothetical protein n=1 Tax=Paenibacillus sp. FSL M8-0228 TaxID=2921620 RepID=UPI0030F7AAF4